MRARTYPFWWYYTAIYIPIAIYFSSTPPRYIKSRVDIYYELYKNNYDWEEKQTIFFPYTTAVYLGARMDPRHKNYYEIIQIAPEMVSGFDSTEAGFPTVTVMFGGMTDSFVVRVKAFAQLSHANSEELTVAFSDLPEGAYVFVAMYDSKGKMLSVVALKSSDVVQVCNDAVKASAFLWNDISLMPQGRKVELFFP